MPTQFKLIKSAFGDPDRETSARKVLRHDLSHRVLAGSQVDSQ